MMFLSSHLVDLVFHDITRFQVISFDLIRVESPLALVINGKKVSAEIQAGIELSTFAKSD